MRKQLRHPWYLWPNRPDAWDRLLRPSRSFDGPPVAQTARTVRVIRTFVHPQTGEPARLVRPEPHTGLRHSKPRQGLSLERQAE